MSEDKKKKILVVEDEEPLREAVKMRLAQEGFAVITAAHGEEGLLRARTESPDLILLDIVMPRMDGVTLMKHLQEKEETKAIPIIFLTNLSDMDTISKVMSEGAFDYLVKSDWDIDDLVSLVKERLRKGKGKEK